MIGYNQLCTVEQAIALKNYGIEQQSMMYWWQDFNGNYTVYHDPAIGKDHTYISAFTSQELRVMIPDVLIVHSDHYLLVEKRCNNQHFNIYYTEAFERSYIRPFFHTIDCNELQARAILLLKLLESKRVDVNECNKQLIKFHNSAE